MFFHQMKIIATSPLNKLQYINTAVKRNLNENINLIKNEISVKFWAVNFSDVSKYRRNSWRVLAASDFFVINKHR